MKNFQNFESLFEKNARFGYKIIIFEHFNDLTEPKYSKFYEDSESDIKSIHFLAKMTQKHDFM